MSDGVTIHQRSLPPGCFLVSGRDLYRKLARQPEVQAMAEWGERLYRERREDHDPGDEDRER